LDRRSTGVLRVSPGLPPPAHARPCAWGESALNTGGDLAPVAGALLFRRCACIDRRGAVLRLGLAKWGSLARFVCFTCPLVTSCGDPGAPRCDHGAWFVAGGLLARVPGDGQQCAAGGADGRARVHGPSADSVVIVRRLRLPAITVSTTFRPGCHFVFA